MHYLDRVTVRVRLKLQISCVVGVCRLFVLWKIVHAVQDRQMTNHSQTICKGMEYVGFENPGVTTAMIRVRTRVNDGANRRRRRRSSRAWGVRPHVSETGQPV